MKKLIIISLFVMLMTSCASVGYVDNIYKNAIVVNQGGTAKVIKNPTYNIKVKNGDCIKFRGHKILSKIDKEY